MAIAVGTGLGSRDIVDVVAERNEEIKKELGAAVVHLQLHRAAALKRAAAADDQGKIVCPQLRVGVGGVGIRIPRRRQNGAAWNAALWMG